MQRMIFVTEHDSERLAQLLNAARDTNGRDKAYLDALRDELGGAHVVTPQEIPKSYITMNSVVQFKDLASNEIMVYSLVFPGDADIEQHKISILAPIGTALLGYRVGDIIEWKVPAGLRRLRVEKILYQPEAAGDYHL